MLKDFDEYNRQRKEQVMVKPPRNTGVACPKCGGELQFTDDILRTSIPPQRQVRCDACQHVTFIVA
jgi:transposase